eukprot:scaffold27570_cov43-Phaeocystis_antarctica.AAC.4
MTVPRLGIGFAAPAPRPRPRALRATRAASPWQCSWTPNSNPNPNPKQETAPNMADVCEARYAKMVRDRGLEPRTSRQGPWQVALLGKAHARE